MQNKTNNNKTKIYLFEPATFGINTGLQALWEVAHDLDQGLQSDLVPSLFQRSEFFGQLSGRVCLGAWIPLDHSFSSKDILLTSRCFFPFSVRVASSLFKSLNRVSYGMLTYSRSSAIFFLLSPFSCIRIIAGRNSEVLNSIFTLKNTKFKTILC